MCENKIKIKLFHHPVLVFHFQWANVIINTALLCCPDSAPLPGYDESFQFGTKETSGCSEGSLLCYESMTWHTAKCLELISIRRASALLTKSNVIVLEIASGEECKHAGRRFTFQL